MSIRVLEGDVREKLKMLPDESVHCVVTSPPYFGLRDYGTGSWEGGDPACDHSRPATRVSANSAWRDDGRANPNPSSGEKAMTVGLPFKQSCGKCGATRTDKQIGLEPTPAEFVAVMVEVFREVRRVLRKDGTLWLNLGDSYATGAGSGRSMGGNSFGKSNAVIDAGSYPANQANRMPLPGLKPKDLIGIPWRVAFALQADGWYLRQDIIWAKPNPMPESVTDRCTKAHEYLFLLSRSPRYHYDAEAVAEPVSREFWDETVGPAYMTAQQGRIDGGKRQGNGPMDGTRNRRSVWTVATQPFKEAHFATFPPDLIEPCIKAGCPKDCCAKCGAPVVREVEKGPIVPVSGDGKPRPLSDRAINAGSMVAGSAWYKSGHVPGSRTIETTGWSPSCSCDAGLVRGTVLDPFGGAGTTGLVADRLQRDAILIELNPEYAEMARDRLINDGPLFADVA